MQTSDAEPDSSREGKGLPVPAITGAGRPRIKVGAGVKLDTEAPPEETGEEESPAAVEVTYRRKDGTTYDQPPGKTILDNPLSNIVVEVDENGQENLDGVPRIKDQLTNPAWRDTWTDGPLETRQFDLGDPAQAAEFNQLNADAHPPGCARVVFLAKTEQFDERTGNFKILAKFKRIRYKKIISFK